MSKIKRIRQRITFAGSFWLGLAIFYFLMCKTYDETGKLDIILFFLCLFFNIANWIAWNYEDNNGKGLEVIYEEEKE